MKRPIEPGGRIIRSLCQCTAAKKLYVISWILFAVFISLVVVLGSHQESAVEVALAFIFAIAGLGLAIELYPAICRLWATPIGKLFLGAAVAAIYFFADLSDRQVLYSLTGENPDEFLAARVVLGVASTGIIWAIVAAFCAAVGVSICYVAGVLGMVSFLLGKRVRIFLCPIIGQALFRLLGFCGFLLPLAFVASLGGHVSEKVAVYAGFCRVPDGRYTSLQPNSSMAFLPGDRVCVAEQLSNGQFHFHTVRRDDLK
jgi:hypothetical protein